MAILALLQLGPSVSPPFRLLLPRLGPSVGRTVICGSCMPVLHLPAASQSVCLSSGRCLETSSTCTCGSAAAVNLACLQPALVCYHSVFASGACATFRSHGFVPLRCEYLPACTLHPRYVLWLECSFYRCREASCCRRRLIKAFFACIHRCACRASPPWTGSCLPHRLAPTA